MTRDEALERSKELDEIVDSLQPLWEQAVQARDNAQAVIDEFGKFRSRIRERQIEMLRNVQDK